MTQNKPAPKVIVIPAKEETAQELEKKKNLRVAAYCRVSTNSEEQLNSYENQKAYYTEKIMTNPDWTMVDVCADEGKTGTSACKRGQDRYDSCQVCLPLCQKYGGYPKLHP